MRFVDKYFYKPNFYHKILSFILLPLSLLYLLVATFRRKCARYYDFKIPLISIGNLIAGGSGKTPFLLEIAKDYENIAVISRGYKRKSKGLLIVSKNGKILSSQEQSGDEAYLLAKNLPNASVIVSKNRIKAILEAKKMGAKIIFLDDGFRFNFKKLNIILTPKLEPYFRLPLPSGLYRENPFYKNKNDLILKEGVDYIREVFIQNATDRMLLLTAIANPSRLDEFLPNNIIGKITLNDHSNFNLESISKKFYELNATSLLVTKKDEVKLKNCKIKLSILALKLNIDNQIKDKIKCYIESNLK
ncbi:MAG: tetraacyldisaccharide 4'-kinase [Helicobacteraceae bacterium]|nr:tetraacyldisaccharide 4'-kinase [Helicobacteraceae bacterium]